MSVLKAMAAVLIVSFTASCAHQSLSEAPFERPEEVLQAVCAIGSGRREVSGQATIRVDSKDGKGQFPASVRAELGKGGTTSQLDVEVTNLLGGTEAQISVKGDHYNVRMANGRRLQGTKVWRGLPLRWATTLFMGKIPCPTGSWDQLAFSGGKSHFVVKQPAQNEIFEYRFIEWNDVLWPEELTWTSPYGKFEFQFAVPKKAGGRSEKWTVRSNEGTVRLMWTRL